ncbi:Tau-tubulin kinase 1 [Liparis tanakae]|uniref:Tau-tubulin kinase 1 n=1 Tax=Liparis tanakae TaxID=230148 RepID=A0A4Z2HNT8_9TELE|nr:Tau-tubulin kinase 1 [Liparis tanakae]
METSKRTSGVELVVRPKTHTRDSSRGMLTLTEEEASRRSGGSPAQSPCHSLPSGRPRRRESEPNGPHRPLDEDRHQPRPNQLRRLASYVFSSSTLETEQGETHGSEAWRRDAAGAFSDRRIFKFCSGDAMSPPEQSAPSPPSPDYRTQGQSEEKEHFHLLPQLRAKRADFLAVMLTGTLPQRRSFPAAAAEEEEEAREPSGPKDDDVTKSESNSEASQKSTERSVDAAPSTLMAEDQRGGQREHASTADADPDLEDASKTLVLFSPGDTRKSPSGDPVLEAELATPCTPCTPCALSSRIDPQEAVGPDPPEAGRLSPALRSDLRPATPIAPASPPFTKVERTFVHIAETSHLNVMSSNGHSARESDRDVSAKASVAEDGAGERGAAPETRESAEEELVPAPPEERLETDNGPSGAPLRPVSPDAVSPVRELTEAEEPPSPGELQATGSEPPAAAKPQIRSRIPILVSEEDSGSERSSSLSARARLRQRARQLDLARVLVQKQQGRWMRKRMASGTSSSVSSGDDERRRASETLSTAGSEEDTHTLDTESRRSCRLKPTEERGSKEYRSRIPRPVTPVKRAPAGLAAPSPLSVPDASATKGAPSVTNGSSSSFPRPSAGPSGSPRMPLRVLLGTRRSLSSNRCRTDSPSPQRACPSRQPLSVRTPTVPLLPPRTTATVRRSASQEAAGQTAHGAAPARTRPKTGGAAKGKPSAKEKAAPAR